MKRHRWWVLVLAIILTGALHAGYGFAKEKGPIKEPKYKSPRVYKDDNGKVVFREFVEDLTVNRIEFYDPDSGELLYGVSLKDGKLVGKREGSAVGENDYPFDESGEIIKHKYYSNNGKTLMRTNEYNSELISYSVIVGEVTRPLALLIDLNKGRIINATREFRLNNEKVHFKRDLEYDIYEEIYFQNNGSKTYRRYKSGFLELERQESPGKANGRIVPYIAFYLKGKHAFTLKNKYNKENFKEEVSVYDSNDKLVSKANRVFGEDIYLKEEVVNGRKSLQVIQHGQGRKKKVEAMRYQDE